MRNLLCIGLDVHKDSIAIAVAEPGRDGELIGLIWEALRDLPGYQAQAPCEERVA